MQAMKQPLMLALPLVALLVSAAPTVDAASVLTPQNFAETTAHGVWLIEHFSPYCRHCRNFEPTWNDVVGHFEAMSDPGIHLAQVNCALNGDLCNENGVTGYPQMNLYRDGAFVETYSANREFGLLVDYLRAHAEPTGVPVPTSSEPEPTPTPPPSPPPAPAPVDIVVQASPRRHANPSGTVVSLDLQSFDNFLSQGPAFVKFFAPWCGHCKKLAPTWTTLGRRMQHKLNIAEVDCELHKALCTSQSVAGFPTMFYYANGVKTEYTGGRSSDQLAAFADRASNPTMQVIDEPELEQVVRDNTVIYLLLHDASDPAINDIAKRTQFLLGSPSVYVSSSPKLFRKHTLPPNTSAALLAFKDRNSRDPVSLFRLGPSWYSAEALHTWLSVNRFPSSFELSKDVFQQVMYAPHNPLVVIVATPQGTQDAVSIKLQEIAQKWRLRTRSGGRTAEGTREVVFTWMDEAHWGKWMKTMYGIKLRTDPEIIVADHEHLLYYDKDGSGHDILFNSVSVASALEAIIAGTARPKHSQNALERTVHSLNAMLLYAQEWIVAHPYMTVLVVLSLMGALFMGLRRLFKDEHGIGWESTSSEKRFVKGGRLD